MNETIKMIKISDLHPNPDNPFKVTDNEELQSMVQSIKDYGIISPIIVRPKDNGGYEIISGHRRTKAARKAGIVEVPAFVREMDKDTAIITLVDSNLHREHILPSEKAFAFKMKLEAIKHQGKATSRQVVGKFESADLLSDTESGRQIQRYIRLTNLIPEILQYVDDGKIAFNPAVDLSYLTENQQADLFETIQSEDCTPSLSQAQNLKMLSQMGILDMDKIFEIMTTEKANQKEQVKFKVEDLRSYFPKSYTTQDIENTILRLLADWQNKRERGSKDAR